MKFQKHLIQNIQSDIQNFLKEKRLEPHNTIKEIFADPTRRTYYSPVTNSAGRTLFLKIRTYDLEWDRQAFYKQRILGEILRTNPRMALNELTPRLMDSDRDPVDYLLYEYKSGEPLGSRKGYGVLDMKVSDITQIISIIQSLRELYASLFPTDFEKRGKSYYKQLIDYGANEKIHDRINIDWKLLDTHLATFSHGDFKPNNFMRSGLGLILLDFEGASLSNPYADILRLFGYAIRNVKFRDELQKIYILKMGKIDKDLWDILTFVIFLYEYLYLKTRFHNLHASLYQKRRNDVLKSALRIGTKIADIL